MFEKGKSGNPGGKRRKFLSHLKSEGYKLHEIHAAMCTLLGMTPRELSEVEKEPVATVLEVTVAKALLHAQKHGTLRDLETLLSRVFGKPREQLSVDLSKLSDAELVEAWKRLKKPEDLEDPGLYGDSDGA